MWTVYYKPDNESQSWSVLDSYYSSVGAITRASVESGRYYMIKVTDPEGSVVWTN